MSHLIAFSGYPRRTTAEQFALIAQLAKLGRSEVAADFFQVNVFQLA